MKSILITGGAGFIGSHTSLLLLEMGFNVVIVDSLVNSSELTINRIKKIVELDFYGYDISFTNSSLAMTFTVLAILLFMYLGIKNLKIIPSIKEG